MKNTFKTQLVKLRQKKDLSQEGLANKLFVSRQSVSKWEHGDSEPDIDKLISLAEIFDVDLDFLIAGIQHPDELILRLEQISKAYQAPVLKNVNLSVYGHDRIALLGSNGSGKSTIVKIILGLIEADSGILDCNYNPKSDLSVMMQENIFIETLRVKEQVIFSAEINEVNSPDLVDSMLEKFKLTEHAQNKVSQLSGGQRRRLALLISLLKPSKLTILDEPTVGMDLESIDFFWDYLDHVGGSVLTITHDFNQIDRYFTRVVLLKDGIIAADKSVSEIHSNNQTIEQWYRMTNQILEAK